MVPSWFGVASFQIWRVGSFWCHECSTIFKVQIGIISCHWVVVLASHVGKRRLKAEDVVASIVMASIVTRLANRCKMLHNVQTAQLLCRFPCFVRWFLVTRWLTIAPCHTSIWCEWGTASSYACSIRKEKSAHQCISICWCWVPRSVALASSCWARVCSSVTPRSFAWEQTRC